MVNSPWDHVNYILELLKNEGDFEALQAFEFLLENVIAWRFTGIAWRNLTEAFEKGKLGRIGEVIKEREEWHDVAQILRTRVDEQHFLLRDIRQIIESVVRPGGG